MLGKLFAHVRNQWMGALALFLVLGGGTAYAVTQLDRNSVKSKHIVNGQVKTADVRDGAVNSAKVADDSLNGADIQEDTLGKVSEADTLDGTDSTGFLGANAKAADADKLDSKDASEFALAGSEAWQPLGLRTTTTHCYYQNFGSGHNPAGFFRDETGIVHLRGLVRAVDVVSNPCGRQDQDRVINFPGYGDGGMGGIPLPPGYRPANKELFTVTANNRAGRIDVHPDGWLWQYLPFFDAMAFFSLDGITFRCAPSGQDGCP